MSKLELTNKLAGLATSARKSGQISQYSKEKPTFAPKLRQKNEIPEHLEVLSGKPVTSAKPKHQIKKISHSIPSHLRKYIWERDQGQCSYVHHKTKRRCNSRHLLQIDHIQPFALGGKTEKENLRLLCAGHNQYRRQKKMFLFKDPKNSHKISIHQKSDQSEFSFEAE